MMASRSSKKEFVPSPAAKRLAALRADRGWSQEYVGDQLGISQPEIRRLESGERKFRVDRAVQLARLFDVDPAVFLEDERGMNKTLTIRGGLSRRKQITLPLKGAKEGQSVVLTDRDLPIRGVGQGGNGRVYLLPYETEPHGWTYRPGILQGVNDAYALWVFEDSMHPMYKHGHVVWVHPHMPIKPGDGVVVIMKDGSVTLKELVRRHNGTTTLRRYKPTEEEFDVPTADIEQMQRIVGSFDDR